MTRLSTIKLWLLSLFACLLLSACQFTITGDVTPTEPTTGISINTRSASYTTNYRAAINGRERAVICDDRATELSYEFNYSGDLIGWTSYLQGVNTGTVKGRESFRLSDNRVERLGGNRVRVTYRIAGGGAPLSTAIDTQGIVVVPNEPTVVGGSRLFLNGDGFRSSVQLISNPIPVVDRCG